MNEIISTPYDDIIANAEEFMRSHGVNDWDTKRINRAEGQRAADIEGVRAERE